MASSSRGSWRAYLLQSLLAFIVVVGVLALGKLGVSTLILIALCASLFIIFTVPQNESARPKNIILGYVLGIICGMVGHFVFLEGRLGSFMHGWELLGWLSCGLAIMLLVLIMSVTETDHPPAAVLAIGVAYSGYNITHLLYILGVAVVLSLIVWWLRPRLTNLF